jgi:hypothetical protein
MIEDDDEEEDEDNENNNNAFQFLLSNKRERSILTTCKGQRTLGQEILCSFLSARLTVDSMSNYFDRTLIIH